MAALTHRSHLTLMFWRERPRAWSLRIAAGWLALAVLALFLARAPLAWCLAAVLGVGGGILLLLRPHLAIYLLAFSVPLGSLWTLQLGGLAFGPSEALLAMLLGAWLMRMAASRQGCIRRSGLLWALLAYLFTILVSFLPARNLIPAVKELFKWLTTLLVFVYVSSNAGRPEAVLNRGDGVTEGGARPSGGPSWPGCAQRRTKEPEQDAPATPAIPMMHAQTLITALLLGGLLQGVLGIYQFLFRVGPPGFMLLGHYMRAAGTFGQPNPYGGYMGLLLPMAYVVVLTRGRGIVAAARLGNWGPLLLWALALVTLPVMSAALIMSWSRGALLGLVGGLALVILALGWRVWLPAGLVLLLLFLAGSGPLAILPPGFVGRALEVTEYLGVANLAAVEIDDDNFAVIERLAHWDAAWQMFERQPWLGVGAGQYADEYPAVALPRWQDPLGHAHNYVLHVMAEGGLLGLAGYLVLTVVSFITLWRAARPPIRRERGMDTAATFFVGAISIPRSPWSRTVGLAALGMWGHLMAHNLFDNLYVHGMYLLVALMLGLVVAHTPVRPPAARAIPGRASYSRSLEAL